MMKKDKQGNGKQTKKKYVKNETQKRVNRDRRKISKR